MKSIKVAEATNLQLNWLVAKIQNHAWRCPWLLQKEGLVSWQSYEQAWGNPTPNYCTDWAEGGPIAEKAGISCFFRYGKSSLYLTQDVWDAYVKPNFYSSGRRWSNVKVEVYATGNTELIAKMRCYVKSNLGPTAEVPDELA